MVSTTKDMVDVVKAVAIQLENSLVISEEEYVQAMEELVRYFKESKENALNSVSSLGSANVGEV